MRRQIASDWLYKSFHILLSDDGLLIRKQCYGIPWSCEIPNFGDMGGNMEVHGTSKLGKSNFSGVAWNSIQLLMSSKLAILKLHIIPWNSLKFDFPILMTIHSILLYTFIFVIWHALFVIFSFHLLCFNINACAIPGKVPKLFTIYEIYTQNQFSMVLRTCFDKAQSTTSGVSWNFWPTLEKHLQKSMDVCSDSVPKNSMELPEKNSMEIHGIPWNIIHLIFLKNHIF